MHEAACALVVPPIDIFLMFRPYRRRPQADELVFISFQIHVKRGIDIFGTGAAWRAIAAYLLLVPSVRYAANIIHRAAHPVAAGGRD